MSDYSQIFWLNSTTVDAAAGTSKTLTSSYATLGGQFLISGGGQLSIKFRHTAAAGSESLVAKVEVSDDPFDTAEGDSVWHQVGGQANASGALTEQAYEYTGTASSGAGTVGLVPLVLPLVGKKCRVRVKSAANQGSVKASVAFLPIV